MKKRILGLDTGTNSLGWAVVDRLESGECHLVDKGVLIFQEGVKIEKGNESSKAAERTQHRSLRKQYFRRRLRKIEVLKVLIKYRWCPYLSDEALHAWHVKKAYPMDDAFLAWQRTDEKLDKNPYSYRHICLHEDLNLSTEHDRYILGRALYHLAQRRGFKSNRLDQSEDSNENGKVKVGISNLSEDMRKAGCEYLGDYFYFLYKNDGNRVRIRTKYTDREEHYHKEFEAICNKQNLSVEQIGELERALYFQRPLKSQRQGVGRCTFETRKPRCAESHPEYEMFRMLSFINNIKVKGPDDYLMRPLNKAEYDKIAPLFFRKSKRQFDFEEIAKAIAGKGNYQYIKDDGERAYRFNYRMSQSITSCPTISSLMAVFGRDYERGMAELYTLSGGKSKRQIVNDVWNVLYNFSDKENLRQWGKEKLQLDDDTAKKFSEIHLTQGFASLSLSAIRKILPWLEKGLIYSHAALMAKVPDIVGKDIWGRKSDKITSDLLSLISNFDVRDSSIQGTLDLCIKDYLNNNYELKPGATDNLYHPSKIEVYDNAEIGKDGVYRLGSPKTNSIRNPMAMRSLHQVRKVVNALLKKGLIDENTEVHVEYARELNDANKRKAIGDRNKAREKSRKEYADRIKELYLENCGKDIEPTEDDILKYELWVEQENKCLYTGKQICICDFIGPNPKYDIEHTIPRSVGGDSTMENLTLCSSRFNREVKKTLIPTQLLNYEEIQERLNPWKERIEKLRKEADRIRTYSGMAKEQKDNLIKKRHLIKMKLEYWQNKYGRFLMTEVPEGFSRRQGAGIGLVGKYAGLYLGSLFHKKGDRAKSNVRVVKGASTAEFRKLWGIQSEYEKKSRDNHIHHCIDAIVIACIGTGEYNSMARYYQQFEEYERTNANKPNFPKPWPTFTEDLKKLGDEILVVHDTPNNFSKHWHKMVRTPKGKFMSGGDVVRGSLHNDTYYGAIMRDGEIKYVVRRSLKDFKKAEDVKNIVDEVVREKVKAVIDEKGFKEAISGDIYMNKDKGILIKKVRCFDITVKNPIHINRQRDLSKKEYKQEYNVQNDGNYIMAIYEANVKGKIKRDYELVRKIDAAKFFTSKNQTENQSLVPEVSKKNGYPIKYKLTIGKHVVLYENSPKEIDFNNVKDIAKRLYTITGLSYLPVGKGYGSIVMKHHQEARISKEISVKNGAYKENESYRSAILMLHTQLLALVEGQDFIITPLGEIKLLHKIC